MSNAERRALLTGESVAVPRILDIYAALPAITGKIELEYEGELKGGDHVARELVRSAVGRVFTSYYEGVNMNHIIQFFDMGGALRIDANSTSEELVTQLGSIQGLLEKTRALGLSANEPDAVRAAAGEFILEGLYAHRRIGRSEELGFVADEKKREPQEEGQPSRRKRQFN